MYSMTQQMKMSKRASKMNMKTYCMSAASKRMAPIPENEVQACTCEPAQARNPVIPVHIDQPDCTRPW